MRQRLFFGYCGLLVLLAAGAAGAGSGAAASGASARAYAIKVIVPGAGAATSEVMAPPNAVQFGGGFAYPGDGSVLTTGAYTASAEATAAEATASAAASAEISGISLFGGEVTVARVAVRAKANAASGAATGDLSQSTVEGLTVGGQPTGGGRVTLGEWGYAVTLPQASIPSADGYRGFVSGLQIFVTAEHGGVPAGTQILIGYAEAVARAEKLPPEPTTVAPPKELGTAPGGRTGPRGESAKKPRATIPPLVRRPLPSLVPRVTTKGYVFPVHGQSWFTDTFGAARAVVGWHHGEDIFAPYGAPVLAVTKGTVFSVGWNDIGGNRLWLRDTKGNEFYYAHLSAFSPLAINGASVQAGDVLGFIGTSGDAEATPPHLHFEFHPVGMLSLGYDGVVNPYPFLSAWRKLEDVRFVTGLGWLPASGQRRNAPRPGAFLLDSADISTASGLEPRSVRRALADLDELPKTAVSAEEAVTP